MFRVEGVKVVDESKIFTEKPWQKQKNVRIFKVTIVKSLVGHDKNKQQLENYESKKGWRI